METVGVFSLLLLICSVSGAELHQNEIIEQEKQIQEPDQSQLCLSDIHAVLREMSAALAEQRVRIKQLQNENQAQAAELSSIKKSSAVTENQVEALMRDRAVRQVAFSASLFASGEGYVGPFNTHTPLVFRHVVSNVGNAYNPNSGFFTAPLRGAYHFEFYISGYGEPYTASGAVLMKNGQLICSTYEHQTSGFTKSANGATLLLEAGDVVLLNLWQNTKIFDDGSHHSTFSGHLLFTM